MDSAKIPKKSSNRPKHFGDACRVATVLFIVAKLGLVLILVIFALKMKHSIFEAIDKLEGACQTVYIENWSEKCIFFSEKIKRFLNMGYLIALIVVGIFGGVELIGCAGAAFGNRRIMCIFIIVNGIFFGLLTIPVVASSTIAHFTKTRNHYAIAQFEKVVDDSLGTMKKLYNETKDQNIQLYRNLTAKYPIQQYNKMNSMLKKLGKHPLKKLIDDAIEKEIKPKEKIQQVMMLVADVVAPHSIKLKVVQEIFDWLQESLECCGMVSYRNWYEFSLKKVLPEIEGVNWLFIRFKTEDNETVYTWEQKCYFTEAEAFDCYVPKSCCKEVKDKCNEANADETDVLNKESIYLTSCKDAFLNKIHHVSMVLALLTSGMMLLIVLSSLTAGCARSELDEPDGSLKRQSNKEKLGLSSKTSEKSALSKNRLY